MLNINDADLIEDLIENNTTIYLGSEKAAMNESYLNFYNIEYVLTALPAIESRFPHFEEKGIIQVVIDSYDTPNFDMYSRLHEAADFIYHSTIKGHLLVHCAAGRSRSATCLMAYYIKYRGLSFDSAFAFIKKKRPIICPNIGFQHQLKIFEKEIKTKICH